MKKIICALALVAASTPVYAGAFSGDAKKAAARAGACEETGVARAEWREDGKLNVWCNAAAPAVAATNSVPAAGGAAAVTVPTVAATNFVPLFGVIAAGAGVAIAASSTSDTQNNN